MTKEEFIKNIPTKWEKDIHRDVWRFKSSYQVTFIFYYLVNYVEALRPKQGTRLGNMYKIETLEHFKRFLKYIELSPEEWEKLESKKEEIKLLRNDKERKTNKTT